MLLCVSYAPLIMAGHPVKSQRAMTETQAVILTIVINFESWL